MNQCKDCMHWCQEIKNTENRGDCRINPPLAGNRAEFPRVRDVHGGIYYPGHWPSTVGTQGCSRWIDTWGVRT